MIHSVVSIMAVRKVNRVTQLRNELFELMSDREFLEDYVLEDGEDLNVFLSDLRKEINGLDIIELNANLSIWREKCSY